MILNVNYEQWAAEKENLAAACCKKQTLFILVLGILGKFTKKRNLYMINFLLCVNLV